MSIIKTVREKYTEPNLVWIWTDLFNDESRMRFKLLFALVVITNLIGLCGPLATAWMLDGAVSGDHNMVYIGLTAFAGFLVLESVLNQVRGHVREKIWNINFARFCLEPIRMYLKKTLGEQLSDDAGIDHSSLETLSNRMRQIMDDIVFVALPSVALIILALALISWLDIYAGIIVLVFIVINLCMMYRVNQHIARTMPRIDKMIRRWYRGGFERTEYVEATKTKGAEGAACERMYAEIKPILREDFALWGLWLPLQNLKRTLIAAVMLVGLMMYCAYAVVFGQMTGGSFLAITAWSGMISNNLWRISDAQRNIGEAIERIKSYRQALITEPVFAHNRGVLLDDTSNDSLSLCFENTSMTHGDNQVLRDISFCVEPGEQVALVGPSGSGKSTLAKLALRYYDCTAGSVTVSDQALPDLHLSNYMSQVGYIPQRPQIFTGTIRENVLTGRPVTIKDNGQVVYDVDDDAVWKALRLAQCDLGDRLTDGLDTEVGRDGVKLSGGEQQRLIIARALVGSPRLLVVDEATSSLDAETERMVQKGINTALGQGVSALVIAHRLETLQHCNKFVVLKRLSDCVDGESQIALITDSYEEMTAHVRASHDAQTIAA